MDKGRRGQALVPVIFVMLILTALAIAFATSSVREVRAASNATAGTQSFAAARGALLYAMYALEQSSSNNVNYGVVQPGSDISVDSNGWWQLGDAWVKVSVVDTGACINLNAATAATLNQMPVFQNNPDLVAAILDWKSSGEQASQNGAKSSYYQTLNPPYNCKDAPFDSVEELLLVRGMSPGLLYGNGDGQAIDTTAGPIGTGSAYTPAAQSASSSSSGGSQGQPQFNDVYVNSRIALAELFTTVSQENNVAADGTKRVDINSATEQQLQTIGLTAAQAQQVVANRPVGTGNAGGGGNTAQQGAGGASGGAVGNGAMGGGASGNSGSGPQMGGPSTGGGRPGSGGTTPPRFARTRQAQGGRPGGGATGGSGSSSGTGGSGNGQGNGSGSQGNGSGGAGSGGASSGYTSIAALLSVPGMNSATLQKIADYLTTDSGSTRNDVVNVNTAPAEVLASVPGMDRQTLNAILNYRQNGQVFATMGDLFALQGVTAADLGRVIEHLSTKSSFYKVHIQVRMPGQQTVSAFSALVQVTGSYPQVLQWREVSRTTGWAYWTTPPTLPAPPIVSTTSTTSGSSSGHSAGGSGHASGGSG